MADALIEDTDLDLVGQVKVALADQQVQIEGVQRSFPQAPNSIVVTDMPLMLNLAGAASYPVLEADYGIEERDYQMLLLVLPQGQGLEGEGETICEPFFGRVRRRFLARPHLGVDFVQNSIITGDTGVRVISFANMPYYGIIFTNRITAY